MSLNDKSHRGTRRASSFSSSQQTLLSWRRFLLWTLVVTTVTVQAAATAATAPPEEDERQRVLVGFISTEARDLFWQNTTTGSHFHSRRRLYEEDSSRDFYEYHRAPAMALRVTPEELKGLTLDPHVASVNPLRPNQFTLFQRQQEVTPYGITMVQATSANLPLPPPPSINSCLDPTSFKICVVDSGLLVTHNDIPYSRLETSIMGRSFGVRDEWWNPTPASGHGTHVTGTLVAQADNGIGVRGIFPNSQGVCLLQARTFDERGTQDAAFITEAVEWCVETGARVINMSLGSSIELASADIQVYNNIRQNENVLVVAASGNLGTSQYAFPASLDSVMSVAAVTEDLQRADFSQFNDQVNIAAPGVNILSTTASNAIALNGANILLDAGLMLYSPDMPKFLLNVDLSVVDCGFGLQVCTNAQGKVCLMERGNSFFWEKAVSCQRGGGIATLIYNNEAGGFGGSLMEARNDVRIPTFALSREEGLELLSKVETDTVTVLEASASYGFLDGTSMATPHVAGVAARIWAARPECTNDQIREALEESALDLGTLGRDDAFGHGLVQAEAAYEYLMAIFPQPCGGGPIQQQQQSQQQDGPGTCVENLAPCASDIECCSGNCNLRVAGGPRLCRAAVKDANRNKLSGEGRGGSAQGGGNRGGRALRGQSRDAESQGPRLPEEDTTDGSTARDSPFAHRPNHNPKFPAYRNPGIVTR